MDIKEDHSYFFYNFFDKKAKRTRGSSETKSLLVNDLEIGGVIK